jgi:ribosomal protein S3AE
MCTNIATKTSITGSAKIAGRWVNVNQATMSFDHANHTWVDHALRIDFVSGSDAGAERVAVELDLESGKSLLRSLEELIGAAEKSVIV